MTLDTRAQRAAQGIHRAVEVMEMSTYAKEPRKVERFDRFRDRKQRNRRIGAVLVAATLVTTAIVVVSNALDRSRDDTPATPPTKPSGRILYKVWDGKESDFLYTIGADATGAVDLSVKADPGATWSPDGTKILVTSKAGIGQAREPMRPATIEPDGSGFTVLSSTNDPRLNLNCNAWSPDGDRMACEGFGIDGGAALGGIYTVRASDGGDLQRVTDFQATPDDYSPDGRRLVFVRPGGLFVVNVDGSGMFRVTPDGFKSEAPSWSPNGRWIAFANPGRPAAGRPAAIYLIHPDGSGLHELALDPSAVIDGATDPSWSPDGAFIAFAGWISGVNSDLYVARADGSHVEQLTDTLTVAEYGPDWAP